MALSPCRHTSPVIKCSPLTCQVFEAFSITLLLLLLNICTLSSALSSPGTLGSPHCSRPPPSCVAFFNMWPCRFTANIRFQHRGVAKPRLNFPRGCRLYLCGNSPIGTSQQPRFKFPPGDVVSMFVATSQQSQPAPSVFRCPCPPWLDRQPCLSRPRQHYDICIFLAMAEAAMPKLCVRRNRHPLPNESQPLFLTASQAKKYVGIAIS